MIHTRKFVDDMIIHKITEYFATEEEADAVGIAITQHPACYSMIDYEVSYKEVSGGFIMTLEGTEDLTNTVFDLIEAYEIDKENYGEEATVADTFSVGAESGKLGRSDCDWHKYDAKTAEAIISEAMKRVSQ